MNVKDFEKPKFQISKVFTTYWSALSAIVGLLAFILSGEQLTTKSALIIIIFIVCLACFIYVILFIIRYLKFLFRKSTSYDRLVQLYGKVEIDSHRKDEIINTHREQLISALSLGFMKGHSASQSVSSIGLSKLQDKHISIIEKSVSNNSMVLTLDAGKTQGIEVGMILSIVTEYSDDLWGTIIIISASKNNSSGQPMDKLNEDFWHKLETDVYHDPSPPIGVKARIYMQKDFEAELEWLQKQH